MAVSLRQVWENLEVTVVNEYAPRTLFIFNFCWAPIEPYRPRITYNFAVEPNKTYRRVFTINELRREWQKYVGEDLVPGMPIMIELVEYEAPNRRIDISNEITYQAWAVPIEDIGAGLGAVIGGVAGYVLKPLGPEVSALIGAGLGGVGGYSLTYLATMGVPEIPIPTFGATLKESGAPARLGKYQITG